MRVPGFPFVGVQTPRVAAANRVDHSDDSEESTEADDDREEVLHGDGGHGLILGETIGLESSQENPGRSEVPEDAVPNHD